MVNSNTREDLYNINATINYGIRFKRGNSLTAKFMHFHKISIQNYTGNQWQHLWTGETIAFAEYQHRFGQRTSLTVTPGISILQYRLHGNKKVSMNSPRLQTRITHQPGQGQFLMFGVSIGNSAPQMATIHDKCRLCTDLQTHKPASCWCILVCRPRSNTILFY